MTGIEQFDGLQTLHRPIFSRLVIGLILGDVKTGLIVGGGSLKVDLDGISTISRSTTSNIVVGGIFGVSLALLSNLDAQTATGLAFPLAVIGQMIVTLMFSLYSGVMKFADKAAEEGNTQGVDNVVYLQLLIRFYYSVESLSYLFILEKDPLLSYT